MHRQQDWRPRFEVVMGGKAKPRPDGDPERPKPKKDTVQIRIFRFDRRVINMIAGIRGDDDVAKTVHYLIRLAPETPGIMKLLKDGKDQVP